jgi:sterol 3beta-glucosyltransferase
MVVLITQTGVMDIVSSVHEGFYNAPKLYGSDVREHSKVTNFTSGMKEAGKVSTLCSIQDT